MPRAGLSRSALVRAGLEVIDDGGGRGFEDLTLAAVAGRVGVAVPSLYKHVGSLADLRASIAVECVHELTAALTAATIGRSGSDALRALAAAYRAYARDHPGRYAATQVAPRQREGDAADGAATDSHARASAATVAVVSAVLAGCVPQDHMVDAIRAVRAGLHGFVALEVSGGFGLPQDVDASFAFLVDALDAGVRTRASAPVPSTTA